MRFFDLYSYVQVHSRRGDYLNSKHKQARISMLHPKQNGEYIKNIKKLRSASVDHYFIDLFPEYLKPSVAMKALYIW